MLYAIERDGSWERVGELRVLGNTFNPTHEQMVAAGYKEVVDSEGDGIIVGHQLDRVDGDRAYFDPVVKTAAQVEQERIAGLCEDWVRDMVADMLVILNKYSITLPVESILAATEELTAKAEVAGSPYDVAKVSAIYTTLRLNGITDLDIPLIAEYVIGGA